MTASIPFNSMTLASKYVCAAGPRSQLDWTAIAVDATAVGAVGG